MAVGYPDRDQAPLVLDTIQRLEIAWLERNDVAAFVQDKKGNPQIGRDRTTPWSALWRGILRSGVSSGAGATDAVTRQASAVGIPDTFAQDVWAMIGGVRSALIIRVRTSPPGTVHSVLCESASHVLGVSLTPSQDALLVSVLDVQGPTERQPA